jgi:hypothetical protein
VLHQLFEGYKKEGLAMPYTMEDFRREYDGGAGQASFALSTATRTDHRPGE